MFQQHASGANGFNMWVIDLAPDENNSAVPNGPRWKRGDPPLDPQLLFMDYHTGAEACERNPLRYRAHGMKDADYAELVEKFRRTSR
jgi:hypothetical protein